MVKANVVIIDGLKKFLLEISEEKEKRKAFLFNERDFSRERILTFERTVGFLINMPKRSLSIEVREFLKELSVEETSTKSAFSQQRSKLKPSFFQEWNRLLVSLFYQHYGDHVKRWRGFLIQAVDGSTAYLINKEEVINHFGTQGNQYVGIPMAQLMQVYDVLNELIVWAGIYPIKMSEQNVMNTQAGSLAEDSITLFDRGYPSFALIYLLEHQPKKRLFVMRCKSGFNKEVKRFMESAEKDIITEFPATDNAIKTLAEQGLEITIETKVKVRLVKIELSSGQTEVLITNLFDQVEYSIEDLCYLYSLRWPIETCYGKEKNQLQLEQFSGHRVICIEQDYHAGIFTANIQSLIEKQSEPYLKAVSKQRKYSYKINRNVSLGALKHNIVKLFLEESPQEILLYLQHLFEGSLEPVRPGRKYARNKKTKRMNGKYQTLTNYKRAI